MAHLDDTASMSRALVPVRNGINFTDSERLSRMHRFCDAYASRGTIRHGCLAAGISRTTFERDWLSRKEFIEMWQTAQDDYNDRLRGEIDRRAVDGVVRTKRVTYKGDITAEYEEIEYSDSLLQFQAKARMPEYREKVTISGDKPINWQQAQSLLDGVPDTYVPSSASQSPVADDAKDTSIRRSKDDVDSDVIDAEYTTQDSQRRPWQEEP